MLFDPRHSHDRRDWGLLLLVIAVGAVGAALVLAGRAVLH